MNVLLIGVGPLPFYRTQRGSGIAYGTWQLCRAMLAAGHRVDLVTMETGCFSQPQVDYLVQPRQYGALIHHPLPESRLETLDDVVEQAQDVLEQIHPACIVSAGSPIASFVTTRLETGLPIWFDLFGEVMSEVQAKLAFGDKHVLPIILDLMKRILTRGDRFSAVSNRQRLMVAGQLSMLGRLNGPNTALGTRLVQTIPAGIDARDEYVHDRRVIRGGVVPRDAFVVLWSGGFNTWADIETLFRGLDEAMGQDPAIHFVATGGAIAGHHEAGFDRFQRLVQRSRHRARYHFAGWVPQETIHNYFLESDVGINVDLDLFESEVGTRTRVLPWFKAGLPVVITLATELSELVRDEGLGYTVPMGRPSALARTLVQCAANRDEVRRRGMRAKRFAYDFLDFGDVAAPLLEWLESPAAAPDRRAEEERPGEPGRPADLATVTAELHRELPAALLEEKRRPWWRRWF